MSFCVDNKHTYLHIVKYMHTHASSSHICMYTHILIGPSAHTHTMITKLTHMVKKDIKKRLY